MPRKAVPVTPRKAAWMVVEMRIRTLTLPSETVGDVTVMPFVVVVDQLVMPRDEYMLEALGRLKSEMGARAALAFEADVEMDDRATEIAPEVLERIVAAVA